MRQHVQHASLTQVIPVAMLVEHHLGLACRRQPVCQAANLI